MDEEKCCCAHRTKERSPEEMKALIHRLNRIAGQIQGIKGMIERVQHLVKVEKLA
jgi:DNA-binding FrmR family transcriptional regulator